MGAIRRKKEVRSLMRDWDQAHPPLVELSILMQDWDDAYNVGSLFRVADSLGVEKLFASGKTPLPPNPMIGVTSLGHHRRYQVEHHAVHEEAARAIQSDGWTLVTVEISEGAVPYHEFDWPSRVCLALGNEANGIYPSVSRLSDAAVYIPMRGKGRSMNVHVAAAIVASHAMLVGSRSTAPTNK